MSAIERCRTAALGGHVTRCEDCAHEHIAYNSCRNRHCPKCQAGAAKAWLAAREAELLPVRYFHLVFTLPRPIADIAHQNKRVLYNLLMRTSADTVIRIAADPKHLGARVGITSVLHTWGSAMTHHPHVHMIAPGGGLSANGTKWITSRRNFFLSVRVLSRLYRRLILEGLAQLHEAGDLQFFGDHAGLADSAAFEAMLAPLRKIDWVVYAKEPFAGPKAVLADVTSFNDRHNVDNGEDGRDGHHHNYSDNCGVEGETDDPRIRAIRTRRQRNLLASLFLSQGTPMLLAGDEIGNSQRGNNNAYCQDNSVGWVNWDKADGNFTNFVCGLSRLRREHPSLRQSRFLHGAKREVDGLPDVETHDLDGNALEWRDPGLSAFGVLLRETAESAPAVPSEDTVFLVFNRDKDTVPVVLPGTAAGFCWRLVLDTSADDPFATRLLTGTDKDFTAPGDSVLLFALEKQVETS